jgi:putative FmdB family regulatory protein
MATYEYLCLACEHPFEQRRPIGGSVDTALRCPSCASDRVRRRFSFSATSGTSATSSGPAPASGSGGGCCGGACACGG